MHRRTISHYCQKCKAANPLGQEFCLRCGTRLMIVVQPPSVRVEVPSTTAHEEHLLERMTMLENTLARLAERLEQSLRLQLRHSETAYSNHALVKSLIEILNECGVVDNGKLETKWRAECTKLNETAVKHQGTKAGRKGRKTKRKLPRAAD
jgi:hypothetical protein